MDNYFGMYLVSATPNPQTTLYAALHQDYSEHTVMERADTFPDETRCGEIAIKRLLDGGRNHFGVFEHPQIVLNAARFPHSAMQQIRTHRISVSMDVQSFRYTGTRIMDVATGRKPVDEVFYLRPLGSYTDRQGARYEYTQEMRTIDEQWCLDAARKYANDIKAGRSEEHARSTLPFDVRQSWVISFNMRSLMHILVMRGKKDAQLECQQFCELILPHFEAWSPQIYEWFMTNQWQKGRLAP